MKTTPILALLAAAALSAADQPDRTLPAGATVESIFFFPDGKKMIASCSDKHIRPWYVGSGKGTADRTLPMGGYLLNSSVLAEPTDSSRKAVRLWDLTADRELKTVSGSRAYISADRKHLAVATSTDRSVSLLNPVTGERRHVLADGLGGPATLLFSPDGATVVSANYDNDVRIWKTQSGEWVRKIEDLTGAMFAGEFTPDGQQLVMGGLDETVYILDAKTFALKRTLKGHGETIRALAISPDGRTLVTGGCDVITVNNPVNSLLWSLPAATIIRPSPSLH